MSNAGNVAGDAVSRFKNGRLLFLRNPKADPYGTHHISIVTTAAAYARRGIAAEVLDITAADFMQRLGATATQPEVIGIHCEQSWGLDLAVQVGGQTVDVHDYLNKPAISHIRDYPFYPWLRARTLAPRRNRLLFFTEKSAVDFVAPLRGPSRFYM